MAPTIRRGGEVRYLEGAMGRVDLLMTLGAVDKGGSIISV